MAFALGLAPVHFAQLLQAAAGKANFLSKAFETDRGLLSP